LGRILAGGVLEANVCHLAAPRPAIEFLFWNQWETAGFGQILAGSLLEAFFCHLKAFVPAIKIAFWDHWEMALLSQILARSVLEVEINFLQTEGKSRLLGANLSQNTS
jgi:hypothetical protein